MKKLILFFLLLIPVTYASIGVSPASIDLTGESGTAEKEILLVNSARIAKDITFTTTGGLQAVPSYVQLNAEEIKTINLKIIIPDDFSGGSIILEEGTPPGIAALEVKTGLTIPVQGNKKTEISIKGNSLSGLSEQKRTQAEPLKIARQEKERGNEVYILAGLGTLILIVAMEILWEKRKKAKQKIKEKISSRIRW